MTDAETRGVVGAATELGGKLIGSLPAQFLMLCVLNLFFILGLLWFLNQQDQARERVLAPIVTSCLQQVPVDVLERLMKIKPGGP